MTNFNSFVPGFNQVLTAEGWRELSIYNHKTPVLTLDAGMKIQYLVPKVVSKHYYEGRVITLDMGHATAALKPSSNVLTRAGIKKAKDITKEDRLNRYYLSQEVEHVDIYEWEGSMYSLFFGSPLFIPIKLNNDYLLIEV